MDCTDQKMSSTVCDWSSLMILLALSLECCPLQGKCTKNIRVLLYPFFVLMVWRNELKNSIDQRTLNVACLNHRRWSPVYVQNFIHMGCTTCIQQVFIFWLSVPIAVEVFCPQVAQILWKKTTVCPFYVQPGTIFMYSLVQFLRKIENSTVKQFVFSCSLSTGAYCKI